MVRARQLGSGRQFGIRRVPAGDVERWAQPLLRLKPSGPLRRRGSLGLATRYARRRLGRTAESGTSRQYKLQRTLTRSLARWALSVFRDDPSRRFRRLRHLGVLACPYARRLRLAATCEPWSGGQRTIWRFRPHVL